MNQSHPRPGSGLPGPGDLLPLSTIADRMLEALPAPRKHDRQSDHKTDDEYNGRKLREPDHDNLFDERSPVHR